MHTILDSVTDASKGNPYKKYSRDLLAPTERKTEHVTSQDLHTKYNHHQTEK
jgi:hypothetical protein